MPLNFILGTAGHIDHGKTALVKALTGTDCDRLPEEKARGITIDIGFAQLDLGDCRLGVVDVPGHERFIRNMLAGATGIDVALLVVAADDSVMPQTREHADILKLLGVRHGVVAITKADLADETSLTVVREEIAELVRGTFLETAPVVVTSSHTKQGIEEMKAAIRAACSEVAGRSEGEPFRLPIDRVFTVEGYGTVVTGSVVSGTCRVGDELEWHREDGTSERVHVRGLNNHGHSVDHVAYGQRAAVNLAGVPHAAVCRGEMLSTPGTLVPSRVITIRLNVLSSFDRPVRNRQRVRVHAGTAEVLASLAIFDAAQIPPGGSALAQLHLERPITTVWGQPVVIRDSSAERTLGGGPVLQPAAAKLPRRHATQLNWIELLELADFEERASAAVWLSGFDGVHAGGLWRIAGVGPVAAGPLVDGLIATGGLIKFAVSPGRIVALHVDRVTELEQRVLSALAALHAEIPLATLHERSKLFSRLSYPVDESILNAVIDRLLDRKQLVGYQKVARADFQPKLNAAQRRLKDQIVKDLQTSQFHPPEMGAYVTNVNGNKALLQDIYDVASSEGIVVHIVGELYLHTDTATEMQRRVAKRLADQPGATVSEIKDLLETSRKFAVPFCEYLDRIRLTERKGNLRVLAKSANPS